MRKAKTYKGSIITISMVRENHFKSQKVSERTIKMMKELLNTDMIWYDTKVPTYTQIFAWITEFRKDIELQSFSKFRAEHDTHNASGKIIMKTTRCDAFRFTLHMGNRLFVEFNSDKCDDVTRALVSFLAGHKSMSNCYEKRQY